VTKEGATHLDASWLNRPKGKPMLCMSRRAVFVLWQQKCEIDFSEQRRAARPAKPNDDIRLREFANRRIRDRCALAKKDERSVLVGDGDKLVDAVLRLGEVHNAVILLHDANMLQIEHVCTLGQHHSLRPAFLAGGHHSTGNATICVARERP